MKNVALVTGASSGIGKEFARIHARYGDLVIIARSETELINLKKELESRFKNTVYVILKDLTEEKATQEISEELKSKNISITYLINNAGFGGIGKFANREWEDDLAMIQLNIIALTSLMRFLLPQMIEENKGRILNVSSTASLMPGPNQAVYFATKAYVTSFSQAIAEELSNTKITVTALLPGATDTKFGEVSGMEKTKLFLKTASAETVAKKGYNAMKKGKLKVKAGVSLSQQILLFCLPIIPKKILLKQIRKMQEPN